MTGRPPRPWTTAGSLAATETVSWGVLYYTLPVLAVPIADDLGTSAARVTGALSVALVVSGILAPAVGTWIDRRGARGLMTSGSVVGIVAVAGWAAADSVATLYASFVVVGLAMAMTFYEPAITVVALYLGSIARRAILAVTVTAALASAIFSPLAAALDGMVGWRAGLLVLAVLLGAVTIPLHAAALPRGAPPARAARAGDDRRAGTTGGDDESSSRSFRRLTTVFAIEKAVATAVTAHIVAFLVERGATLTGAAVAAGAIGLAKIAGRAAVTAAARRHAATGLASFIFAIQALALLAPFALPAQSAFTLAALIGGFGATSGAATVLWPFAILDRFGTRDFGRRNGLGAMAGTLPRALAPGAVSLAVAVTGAYTAPWVILAVASALASASARRLRPTTTAASSPAAPAGEPDPPR